MSAIKSFLYRASRFYWHHFKDHTLLDSIQDAQQASDLIYEHLCADAPCMIARFGGTEMKCVMNYLSIKEHKWEIWNFVTCKTQAWWWTPEVINDMQNLSGFFPSTEENLQRFAELFLDDLKQIDILGSWLEDEKCLVDKMQNMQLVQLLRLEPYHAIHPWSRALSGKKVLVIHPFADLIKQQYRMCRTQLFDNPEVLPAFELTTLKAVQSLGGENEQHFTSWFDALAWMESEMDKIDYDVCLIGCGAYGMSLAAHAKRMGKKAVHLGGALQLLFGIKGNRWDRNDLYGTWWGIEQGFYTRLLNHPHWVRPDADVKPRNAQTVENGCYW